ncbi:MAG: hypothetical protein L6Q77_08610 [Bacteroidetes bacterium]|nr:hypothetical protein [Bacteroidota bacterium]
MTLTLDYTPISCSWHDRLIQACERRESLLLEISVGDHHREFRFIPVDIFTRDSAEWLKSDQGELIRLDRIVSVNGEPLAGVCQI